MQQVIFAGSTNNTDDTVIKVVSADNALTWLSPAENAVFKITQDALLPDIFLSFTLNLSDFTPGRGRLNGRRKPVA